MRYSTLATTVNAMRPATGVHAKPLPAKESVTVCAESLTVVWQLEGNSRPMAFGSGAMRSAAERCNISGHSRPAPKFEKSHHLSDGLAFTGPLKSPHPATSTSVTNKTPARKLHLAGRSVAIMVAL